MIDFFFIFSICIIINISISFFFGSNNYCRRLWKKVKHLVSSASLSSSSSNSNGNLTNQNQNTIVSDDDEDTNNPIILKEKEKHSLLLRKYLIVYLLAAFSDWIQGPYVYALYSAYGYSQHNIAYLFVAGYGSSMVFGSFVGGMADWGGRRNFVILFSILFATNCLTKHFRHFGMLLFGRILAGIATSLLFSVFEAWLIKSHSNAQLKHYLSISFSWASYGNSIIAILAGLVANTVTQSDHLRTMNIQPPSSYELFVVLQQPTLDQQQQGNHNYQALYNYTMDDNNFAPILHVGGYLNSFDVALFASAASGICAFLFWEENYGDESALDDVDDNDYHHNREDFIGKNINGEEKKKKKKTKKKNKYQRQASASFNNDNSPGREKKTTRQLSMSLSNDSFSDRGKITNEDYHTTTSSSSSNERHGKQEEASAKWYEGLKNALLTTMRNNEILLAGIISALFEGSMYIFVFMWTPALSPHPETTTKTDLTNTTTQTTIDYNSGDSNSSSTSSSSSSSSNNEIDANHNEKLPFGIIFSTFMVCCMIGSSLFSICIANDKIKIEKLIFYELIVASISMFVIAHANENNTQLKFFAMNVFEIMVGMYWPSMGMMKGSIVPEGKRSAIYSLFRIPLNFIVLFSLLTSLSTKQSFYLNFLMISIASVLQYNLSQRRSKHLNISQLQSPSQPSLLETKTSTGTIASNAISRCIDNDINNDNSNGNNNSSIYKDGCIYEGVAVIIDEIDNKV